MDVSITFKNGEDRLLQDTVSTLCAKGIEVELSSKTATQTIKKENNMSGVPDDIVKNLLRGLVSPVLRVKFKAKHLPTASLSKDILNRCRFCIEGASGKTYHKSVLLTNGMPCDPVKENIYWARKGLILLIWEDIGSFSYRLEYFNSRYGSFSPVLIAEETDVNQVSLNIVRPTLVKNLIVSDIEERIHTSIMEMRNQIGRAETV